MIKGSTSVESGSDMPRTWLSDEPSGCLASAVVHPMTQPSLCMDPETVEATVGSPKVAPSDSGSLGSSDLVPVAKERETATVKADRKPPLAKGFLRRGFFGPCSSSSPSLHSSEVKVVASSEAVLLESKSAKFGENGEVAVEGYSEDVLNAAKIAPILGLSFGGDEKRLKDLLAAIERDRCMEDGV
jgi:hypothetical protein